MAVRAQSQATGRRRALVIGIGRYADERLADLPSVADQTRALAAVLADPDIGGYDVRVVTDATHVELSSELAGFYASSTPDDTLLVAYAGHDGLGSDGWLLLTATDTRLHDLPGTGVPAASLWVAGPASFANLYVMLDCPHSGYLAGEGAVGRARTALLMSAREGDPVTDAADFTATVVRGLGTGAADLDGDGVIDATDLFAYVRETAPGHPGLLVGRPPTEPIAYVPARAPEPPAPKTDVRWHNDAPATVDLLRRAGLVDVLAGRLREERHNNPGNTFSMHLDGAWGTGKTSLLNLIERQLGDDYLVVRFNAWRQSRLGPAWWALLTSVRAETVRTLPWWRRPVFAIGETFTRARRTGMPWVFAVAVLLVIAGPLLYLAWPRHFDVKTETDVLKLLSTALALAVPLWAVSKLVGRFLLWHSARSARLFEEAVANPLREIYEHFQWLIERAPRPVLLVVDDLDRCTDAYVVDFLETLQTLVREDPAIRARRVNAASFLVAADGAWLRCSFAETYRVFDGSVSQPGRPLGSLFLDKFFQLTVPMPALGSTVQDTYFATLLGVDGASPEVHAAQVSAVRAQFDSHRGDEPSILRALETAAAPVREELASEAALALTEPAARRRTEHALRRFAPLLEPNPRSMKLMLNTYCMLRAVRTLEGNLVDPAPLALWSILTVRWPSLAAHLAARPDAVEAIVDPLWIGERFPEPLREVAASGAVRAVVTHADGGPLTPRLVRRCCGAYDGG